MAQPWTREYRLVFFDGLDAYWKTWLQFVFPIYIWFIAGLIIVVCHFSTKATRLFGGNAVQVLATLFLFSYAKLLRTIVIALRFSSPSYSNDTGEPGFLWSFDGNVPYCGTRHSILFVAAVLVLLVLWLPYSLALLLVPVLKRVENNVFCLRWINTLKPLFDACYGPLKDHHHYWVGLMLLVRVVFAISAVATQAVDPAINLLSNYCHISSTGISSDPCVHKELLVHS